MQPARTQNRPPPTVAKDGNEAAGAEIEQDLGVGRQDRQGISAAHDVAAVKHGERQADDVEHRASVHDQRDEPEVVAELTQHGAVAPQPGIASAARIALVVIDPDERSAGCTDDRPGFLPLEHCRKAYNIRTRGLIARSRDGRHRISRRGDRARTDRSRSLADRVRARRGTERVPGYARQRRRAGPRRDRTRGAGCGRDLPHGCARQHLASAPRGVRRDQHRRPRERPRRVRGASDSEAGVHVVVSRAATRRRANAAPRQRLPAHQGGGPAGGARRGRARRCPS